MAQFLDEYFDTISQNLELNLIDEERLSLLYKKTFDCIDLLLQSSSSSPADTFDPIHFENLTRLIENLIACKSRNSLLLSAQMMLNLLKLLEKQAMQPNADIVLNAVLKISSEIELSSHDTSSLLEALANVEVGEPRLRHQIKEKLVEKVLEKFKLEKREVDALIKDKTFLSDLRLVSLELNSSKTERNSFDLDIFVKYNSFGFLVKLLDLLLNRIATSITRESSDEESNDEESNEAILKDLLEIICTLVMPLMTYEKYFLEENILQTFIQFFQSRSMIENFCERYLNLFYKLMYIFQTMSRKVFYNQRNGTQFEYFRNESESFLVLKDAKLIFATMHFSGPGRLILA